MIRATSLPKYGKYITFWAGKSKAVYRRAELPDWFVMCDKGDLVQVAWLGSNKCRSIKIKDFPGSC